MKMLKTIHFDQTDFNVYEKAADSDEWAISGAFAFLKLEDAAISGKIKQAFTNGFLSLESFGRSTFVSVTEINADKKESLCETLARHFHEVYGAPSLQSALPTARHELDYICDLCCEQPINTIFTVRRYLDDANEIREEFRTVTPPSKGLHTKIWEIVEDE